MGKAPFERDIGYRHIMTLTAQFEMHLFQSQVAQIGHGRGIAKIAEAGKQCANADPGVLGQLLYAQRFMCMSPHILLGSLDEIGQRFWFTGALQLFPQVVGLAIDQCIDQDGLELLKHKGVVEWVFVQCNSVSQHGDQLEEVIPTRGGQVEFGMKL